MKRFKIISILLFLILLLTACGQTPASEAGDPDDAAGLYTGPYEGILPMSVPEISEADKSAFNPDRIFDYLAGAPYDCHDYAITGWKAGEGRLYLNITDRLNFDDPNDAYFYIKDSFALGDDALLRLPVFSHCHVEEGSLTDDSSLDLSGYGEKVFDSIPVADDASIFLPGDYGAEINTVQEFIDEFVNGKYKGAGIIQPVLFDYENGQIIGVYPGEEYDNEADYEDGGSEDILSEPSDESISPQSFGFGSLPKALLDIKPVSKDSFDPDNAVDYVLAEKPEFEDCYFLNSAKLENGKLYLYLIDSVSVDADTAYQYLKKAFHLSDKDILEMYMFSENDCTLHNGKMYTPDGWNVAEGNEPEDYNAEYNYNSIDLKNVTLPEPVPVADSAAIYLVDYGGYFADNDGKTITKDQFADYLLGEKGEDNIDYLSNLWFKYSNGEITAIAEQYVP